jgi:hypothetical protein
VGERADRRRSRKHTQCVNQHDQARLGRDVHRIAASRMPLRGLRDSRGLGRARPRPRHSVADRARRR